MSIIKKTEPAPLNGPAYIVDNSGKYIYAWSHRGIYIATYFSDFVKTRGCRVEDVFTPECRPWVMDWVQPLWKPFDTAANTVIPAVLAMRPKHWVLRCATSLDGMVYKMPDGRTPEYMLEVNQYCKIVDTSKAMVF